MVAKVIDCNSSLLHKFIDMNSAFFPPTSFDTQYFFQLTMSSTFLFGFFFDSSFFKSSFLFIFQILEDFSDCFLLLTLNIISSFL